MLPSSSVIPIEPRASPLGVRPTADQFLAPDEDTVFEANIFPHLVLAQNFTDIIDITANNLGLLENIHRVHVGATFNQTGFFRFRVTTK